MLTHNKLTVGEVELTYTKQRHIPMANKIVSSRDAEQFLRYVFNPLTIEHRETFWMVCLDQGNVPIGIYRVSDGGINATMADIRLIFQNALLCNAVRIIVSHNHPSGQKQPSDADRQLTNRIKEAGKLLDIALMDHIIMTVVDYTSFADEGLL